MCPKGDDTHAGICPWAEALFGRWIGQPLSGQLYPIRAAQWNQVVVEVVAGVVQGARPSTVAHFAVRAVAIGNEHIGAGLGLEHEREVFGAHGGLLRLNILGAHNACHHLACKLGFGWAVDGGRVVTIEMKLGLGIKGGAQVVRNLAHARFNQVEHFNAEGAHSALNNAEVGHHIGGLTRVDHGDRNYARIDGLFVARDDGLEGLYQLACHGNRVNAVVGQGGMAAFSANGNFEFVARRHDGARADGKGTGLRTWPVVHAKHGLHGALVEHAVFDHFARTTTAFFGGLENQINRAIKIAVVGQMLGCRQQHGGVAVVTASMHFSFVLAGMCKSVELLHRQGVHVGSEAHTASASTAVSAVHHTHHTGGSHAAQNGNAPIGELLGHHIGCANFLEAQLGVGVNVFANGRYAGGVRQDGIDDFHNHSLPRLLPMRYNP